MWSGISGRRVALVRRPTEADLQLVESPHIRLRAGSAQVPHGSPCASSRPAGLRHGPWPERTSRDVHRLLTRHAKRTTGRYNAARRLGRGRSSSTISTTSRARCGGGERVE